MKIVIVEASFYKVAGLKACNFIEKRLQHKCFSVNIAKFLRTSILNNMCERLLLTPPSPPPILANRQSIPIRSTFRTQPNIYHWTIFSNISKIDFWQDPKESRGVFRTQTNIYDGPFFAKICKIVLLFLQKSSILDGFSNWALRTLEFM